MRLIAIILISLLIGCSDQAKPPAEVRTTGWLEGDGWVLAMSEDKAIGLLVIAVVFICLVVQAQKEKRK